MKKALNEGEKIDLAKNTNWPFIGPFLKILDNTGILKELKPNNQQYRQSLHDLGEPGF